MNRNLLATAVLALVASAGCAAEQKMALSEISTPEMILDTVPDGARVRVDGLDRGSTPFVIRVPDRTSNQRVTLEREGFLAQEVMIRGEDVHTHNGQRVIVPLRPGRWDPASPAIEPEDPIALVKAGSELSRANQCAEALQFFQRALQVDPRQPGAHMGVGICHAKANRRTLALQAYKQFLLYAPPGPEADKVREIVSRAEGDIEIPGRAK